MLNLNHPNIVKFYEVLENDDNYYLIYEYFFYFLEKFWGKN